MQGEKRTGVPSGHAGHGLSLLVNLVANGMTVSEIISTYPYLDLSHDVFNERSGTIIAMALTSRLQRPGFSLTLELQTGDMPRRSWVKISQIRTLLGGQSPGLEVSLRG